MVSRRLKVLLVDEDLKALVLMRKWLEGVGDYTVNTVARVSLAETVIRGFKPDVVVLNLDIREKLGLELCRSVKLNKDLAHIRIMGLTAAVPGGRAGQPVEHYVDIVLTKPFETAEFLKILNS